MKNTHERRAGMITETLSMVGVIKGWISACDELKADLWILCYLGGITVLVDLYWFEKYRHEWTVDTFNDQLEHPFVYKENGALNA